MTDTMTILGMARSLRTDSYNWAAWRAAPHLAPAGTQMEMCDFQGIPLFNQDDEQHPPAHVVARTARIRAAEAMLLVTPEYNYSLPGVRKHALDWAALPDGSETDLVTHSFHGFPAASALSYYGVR